MLVLVKSARIMNNIVEKIYRAGLKFLTPLDLDQTYKLIVEEAMKLVRAENGTIILVENGEFNRVYSSNPKLYNFKIRKNGYIYQVFKTHQPLVLSSQQLGKVHPLV